MITGFIFNSFEEADAFQIDIFNRVQASQNPFPAGTVRLDTPVKHPVQNLWRISYSDTYQDVLTQNESEQIVEITQDWFNVQTPCLNL